MTQALAAEGLELPTLSHADHALLIRVARILARDPHEPGESWTKGLIVEYLEFAQRRSMQLDEVCHEHAPAELRHLFEPTPLSKPLAEVVAQAEHQLKMVASPTGRSETQPALQNADNQLDRTFGAIRDEQVKADGEQPKFISGNYIIISSLKSKWLGKHGRITHVELDPQEKWVYFVIFAELGPTEVWFCEWELTLDFDADQSGADPPRDIPPTPSDGGDQSFF